MEASARCPRVELCRIERKAGLLAGGLIHPRCYTRASCRERSCFINTCSTQMGAGQGRRLTTTPSSRPLASSTVLQLRAALFQPLQCDHKATTLPSLQSSWPGPVDLPQPTLKLITQWLDRGSKGDMGYKAHLEKKG